MATTKDSVPWTFASDAQTGMSFGTVVRTVKRPRKCPTAPINLSPVFAALEGNIALFSHGQFGGVLAARWIGLPVVDGQHFPLGAASLSILAYAAHHPEVPVLEQWNAAPASLLGKQGIGAAGSARSRNHWALRGQAKRMTTRRSC